MEKIEFLTQMEIIKEEIIIDNLNDNERYEKFTNGLQYNRYYTDSEINCIINKLKNFLMFNKQAKNYFTNEEILKYLKELNLYLKELFYYFNN